MSTRAGSLAPTTCASWSPRSMTLGDHSSRVALPSSQIVTRMQYVTHSRSIRGGGSGPVATHAPRRRVEADVLENLFIGDELRLYPHQRQHQDASWCQGRAAMPRFRLQDLASLRSQC